MTQRDKRTTGITAETITAFEDRMRDRARHLYRAPGLQVVLGAEVYCEDDNNDGVWVTTRVWVPCAAVPTYEEDGT